MTQYDDIAAEAARDRNPADTAEHPSREDPWATTPQEQAELEERIRKRLDEFAAHCATHPDPPF